MSDKVIQFPTRSVKKHQNVQMFSPSKQLVNYASLETENINPIDEKTLSKIFNHKDVIPLVNAFENALNFSNGATDKKLIQDRIEDLAKSINNNRNLYRAVRGFYLYTNNSIRALALQTTTEENNTTMIVPKHNPRTLIKPACKAIYEIVQAHKVNVQP